MAKTLHVQLNRRTALGLAVAAMPLAATFTFRVPGAIAQDEVVVTMVTERATQRLSGASVVREDASQAVIRGVLAAVNRRLAAFLPR